MDVAEAPRIRVVRDEDGPKYFCAACRDEWAAWRMFWCAGRGDYRAVDKGKVAPDIPISQCARRADHLPHTYVERCQCSDTNPVVAEQRRRLEEFRLKKKAESKRGRD